MRDFNVLIASILYKLIVYIVSDSVIFHCSYFWWFDNKGCIQKWKMGMQFDSLRILFHEFDLSVVMKVEGFLPGTIVKYQCDKAIIVGVSQ